MCLLWILLGCYLDNWMIILVSLLPRMQCLEYAETFKDPFFSIYLFLLFCSRFLSIRAMEFGLWFIWVAPVRSKTRWDGRGLVTNVKSNSSSSYPPPCHSLFHHAPKLKFNKLKGNNTFLFLFTWYLICKSEFIHTKNKQKKWLWDYLNTLK